MLTAAWMACAGGALAQQAGSPAKTFGFRKVQWDDLIPKGWDPFKGMPMRGASSLSDADPRASSMMRRLRAVLDNAPTVPSLEGARIKIPGYVVPLDAANGMFSEFLLVPYFGACIHVPPPPANQVVYVRTEKSVIGFSTMDTVWVSGTLHISRFEADEGTSGYMMDALMVDRYTGDGRN